MELPKNTSFSARETLERCARSYFLSRLAKAPKRPALWSVGGSAVHETTEHYDLMSIVGNEDVSGENIGQIWETYFESQLHKAFEAEPNEYLWGRSKAEPIEVWRKQGLAFVESYIDWRERSPWEIWTTPDGQPAIELDVSGFLPGCPVEIKAYLDRVFHDPVFGKLWIVDLKSGKRPPKSPAQFETYAALLKAKYDVQVDMGVPFMNRKGTPGKPCDLSEVSPEEIGAAYGKAWEQVQDNAQKGVWLANTNECFICDVQASCAAVNGPLAPRYDPASPGYQPAF
ncbi:PD-(D/E)XK nuclease family protein [Streptomyces sp. NPDC002928]|uniref:RecB family exonuclease n=1 Tax=Streptomyces sp. NPDC002928 TaxID=3154440 RepID=UPI0033A3897B